MRKCHSFICLGTIQGLRVVRNMIIQSSSLSNAPCLQVHTTNQQWRVFVCRMQQICLPSQFSGALKMLWWQKVLWWQKGQSAVEGRLWGRKEETWSLSLSLYLSISLSLHLSISLCFVAMACNRQFVMKANVQDRRVSLKLCLAPNLAELACVVQRGWVNFSHWWSARPESCNGWLWLWSH